MAKRRNSSSHRHGSSPFGYVIFGIVAGLGIAAAIAYYLREHSPKPASHTAAVTSPPQQAVAQPTTPPAVATSPDSYPVTSIAESPQPVTSVEHIHPSGGTTQQPLLQREESSKSDDPIGKLIHTMSNPTVKPVPQTSPADKPKKAAYLQVGSFANLTEADAKRAQLLMQGFSDITISKVIINHTEFYRVRLGPFSSEASLKETRTRLKAKNIEASILR